MDTPAHEMTRAQWKCLRGIHTPWVGEVSGVQRSLMSGAAQRRYDAERRAEWQASADAATDYARLVIEAYDADESVLGRASQDARDVIHGAISQRLAAARAERVRLLAVENEDLSSVCRDDTVWWLVGNYPVRVTKVLRASLRVVVRGGREIRVDRRECRWLHHDGVLAAEAAGRTIAEQRATMAVSLTMAVPS